MKINFLLNNKKISIDTLPTRRLSDVLRDDFNLIGTKQGCGEGECGACTIHLDNKAVPSCLIPVANIIDREIWTIEGIRQHELFPIIEDAFEEAGSVQCGFCIPGIVMTTWALLRENQKPTEQEIRIALSGNLCRCTGYAMIIDGIQLAAKEGGKKWKKA